MKLRTVIGLALVSASIITNISLVQAEGLKPFVLGAEPQKSDPAQVVGDVKTALQAQGFDVVGAYEPYPNATVIVVTSGALKDKASKSDFGGYGAIMRVAVTKVKDKVQVSYTNPPYWAAAYRMADGLEDVKAKLEAALGKQNEFGSKKGLTEKELRKYKYMIGRAKFDSLGDHQLAEYKTYQEAKSAVEAGLAAGKAGVTKVYGVDIPGKDESVYGVAITKGKGADKYIMDYIDFGDVKSTAHLPHEILIAGNKVYHLYAEFRIAISFPDLSMMGSNSFMSIMSAPGAIKDALKETVTTDKEKK
jgi:hypothetical protein